MHVLSRKSFAGPAALRSRKLDVLQRRNATLASCRQLYLFRGFESSPSYFLSLAKQRH